MAQTLECVGVIFQFNGDGVLFEFSADSEEDMIGIVMPYNIRFNENGETIPEEANTSELLLKYIQAGDELRCTVEIKSDLPKHVYEEEDEEIGVNGETSQTTRTVEVEPKWLASSAELVILQKAKANDVSSLKESENVKVINTKISSGVKSKIVLPKGNEIDEEEVGFLEEQLGEMFDYEEDIILLQEDVDIPDFEETKREKPREADESKSSSSIKKVNQIQKIPSDKDQTQQIQSNKAQIQKIQANKDQTQKTQANKDQTQKTQSNKDQTHFDLAKLVQLKKPDGSEDSPVLCGIFEILSGRFSQMKVTVSSGAMYAWGHHLSKANLMHVLKFGDTCNLEYRIVELKHTDDQDESSSQSTRETCERPIVKTLWFGPTMTVPAKANNNPAFCSWLVSHERTEAEFIQWVKNQLPLKNFFPFPADIYHSKVIGFVREETGFEAVGVFLEIKEVFCTSDDFSNTNGKTKSVEESKTTNEKSENPETVENNNLNQKVALLLSKDLYICGVNVEHSDLRVMLKIGDLVFCQIQNINNIFRRKLKKQLNQVPTPNQVTHIAYLGYLGDERPMQPDLKPSSSPNLKEYLKSKGITIEEFESMRNALKKTSLDSTPQDLTTVSPLQEIQQKVPGVKGPFLPQVPLSMIENATNLAARAVNLTSVDDLRIRSILATDEDITTAIKITKVLNNALIFKMQTTIKEKFKLGLPTVEELKSRNLQVDAAQKVISGSKLIETNKAKTSNINNKSETATQSNNAATTQTKSLNEQFKEVQEKLLKEAEAAKAVTENKPKPIVRDMKKVLQSYKAAKAATEKQEASPLELLREYTKQHKFISSNQDAIWFNNVGFPKTTKVNIKIGFSSEYYTLGALRHFLTFRPTKNNHDLYMKEAISLGLTSVIKMDSDPIMKYLSGSTSTLRNLSNITHRELNPQLFKDPATDSKETTVKELHKDGPKRASLNTIKNETTTRVKKSRFDQPVPASKGFFENPTPLGEVQINSQHHITGLDNYSGSQLNQQPTFNPPIGMAANQLAIEQQLKALAHQQQGQTFPQMSGFTQNQSIQGFHQPLQNFNQNYPQQSQSFFQPIQGVQNQMQNYASQQIPSHQNNLHVWDSAQSGNSLVSSSTSSARPVENSYRNRENYGARYSPTFERMQEVRPQLQEKIVSRSPSLRDDLRPDMIEGGKSYNDHTKYDPFKHSASPIPSSYSGFDAKIQDPFRQSDKQRNVEFEQQRMWEDIQRTREAELRYKEEEELARLRKEQEEQRIRLLEIEERRARDQKLQEDEERMWKMSMEQTKVTRSVPKTFGEDDWEVNRRRELELEIQRKESKNEEMVHKPTRVPPPAPKLSNYGPGTSPDRIVRDHWEEERHSRMSLNVNEPDSRTRLFEQSRRDPSERDNRGQGDLNMSQRDQRQDHYLSGFDSSDQRRYF